MKFKKTIPLAAFTSLAAMVLAVAPAGAAVVSSPTNNDIFLGFRATGNTGATTSYLVNLGQYSQFRNAAPGTTFTLDLGNLGADLVSTYGSNWNTRQDLFWGVFGVSNTENPTVYGSREQTVPGTIGQAWAALDATSRGTTASSIVSVLQQTNGYQGRESTLNSAVAVLQPNSGGASSYAKQVGTAGTNDFGSLSEWSSIEGDFGSGTSGTALDLFRIGSLGVTTPGFFTISNSGALSFTAVPEPSLSLLGLAGVVLLATTRRRSQQNI